MTMLTEFWQQPLPHGIVHALGWTLLHFCWQGALVAGLLWCVLALVGSRSARVRYGCGCAALLLMTALPLMTFARLAAAEPRNAFPVMVPAITLEVSADGAERETLRERLAHGLDAAAPWVPALWAVGLVVFLGRLNYGLVVAGRLKSSGTEPAFAELLNVFEALQERLGVKSAVGLVQSTVVQVPTVIGWLRPMVLVPVGCFMGLSSIQVEALLAHELAHIRRHDYLVSVLQSVVEALLFYHPAVWWVSRQVRRERECCCDELAVRVSGDRLGYARALSLLEERRPLLPALALGANGGVLTMRIKRLLGRNEEMAPGNLAWALVLTVAIAGSAGVIGRFAYAQERPPARVSVAGQTSQGASSAETQAERTLPRDEARRQVEAAEEQVREAERQAREAQRRMAQAWRASDSAERGVEVSAADGEKLKEAQKRLQDAEKSLSSDAFRRQMEGIRRLFDSPEFKQQIEQAGRQIDGPEFRKQMERMKERINSPQFKAQIKASRAAVDKQSGDFKNDLQAHRDAARKQTEAYQMQADELQRWMKEFDTPQQRKRLADIRAAQLSELAKPQDPAAAQTTNPSATARPSIQVLPAPVRVSPGVMAGQMVSRVDPVYPPEARAAGVQGAVVLHAVIDKGGLVQSITVVSGPPMLAQSALDAVRQWTYKPYLLNGQPVEVETTINVNYTLQDSGSAANAEPVPGVTAPMIVLKVNPDYTAEARAAKVQGVVVLRVRVNEKGEPENVAVVRSLDPALDKNAMAAVSQWRFKPATKDGKPVAQTVNLEVNYKLI
jgi:TonB family protein